MAYAERDWTPDRATDTSDPLALRRAFNDIEDRVDAAVDVLVGGPVNTGYGVNVKAYGAEGDGVTDDTVAIAEAIEDVQALGGGIVFFPTGTYITELQVIHENMAFVGEGFAASTLKLKENENTDLVQTPNFDTDYATGGDTLGQYGWQIRDLTLDGNYAQNAAGGYCLRTYGYGFRIKGLRCINGVAGGWHSAWGTNSIAINMEAHIEDLTISECAGTGLNWEGPHDSIFSNGEIWTLAGGRVMDYCIRTHGNAAGEKFLNTHTWGKQTVGWRLEKRISAYNCTAEGAYDINLWLVANHSRWDGDIYGTNRNGSNNLNEGGVRFGDSNLGTGTADCWVTCQLFNFMDPCRPIQYQLSFSNRISGVSRMPGATGTGGRPSILYNGSPNNEHAYITSSSNTSVHELKLDPRPAYVARNILTTKGDTLVATGASTAVRLPVGADGTVPTADSTQASGLRWGLPVGAVVTLGLNQIGDSINGLSANVKYGSRFQVPGDLEIRTIQVPFDGLGAVSGNQKVKVVIHDDDAGGTIPGTLLATSDEVTILAGEAMSWRTFTLPADLALTTGYVWLGFHGGTTSGTARYAYTTGAGGNYAYKSDTYAGGADSTFGTPDGQPGSQLLNIRATSLAGSGTPGSLTGQDDGATQGVFDTLNAGDGLTLTVTTGTALVELEEIPGGNGVVTTVIDSGSLSAAEETVGPWVDTGSSGGVFLSGSAKSDVAGTLYLEDSSDGVAAVIRNQLATASVGGNHVANILALTGQRYVRVRYVNGGGAATGFELVQGYSITV